MRRFIPAAAAAIILLICAAVWSDWRSAAPADSLERAKYVGSTACADCHRQEHADWTGSHHDLAMQPATADTVLADFNDTQFERFGVTTRFFRDGEKFVGAEGPDGEQQDYEVKYTFGVEPLQQYMVEFPDGRVQVLRVSWDTENKNWFYVTPPDVTDERIFPEDPLHWTGVAQNWNTTCAECHSTNLQKNYDFAKDTYHTTWTDIDVGCEECHGPGSLHVELANANSLFWDRVHGYGLARLKGADSQPQIEACAKCHSRRDAVHPDFRPGKPLLDYYEPSLLSEALYHADGQILDEVYVYGSFLQSKMHTKGVRCSDCHNPHSLELKFEGNALCAQCHLPAKYDTPLHHHHLADSEGASCVECHMPATTYMVVDPRRNHSLRIPRPDLSVALGTPNACNNCHTKPEENAEWASEKVVEWYGPKRPDDPHWAPAFAAARRGDPEGEQLLLELLQRNGTPTIVRATAIELLPQYGSPESRAAVQAALEDFDPLVRLAAVHSTSADTAQALVDRLDDRLEDASRAVRSEAARRLAPFTHVVTPSPQGNQVRSLIPHAKSEAFQSALAEYEERQQIQSDRASGHLNLASLARDLNDPVTMQSQLRAAIRVEPYLSGPRGELASLLESQPSHDPEVVERLRREEAERLARDVEFFPEDPVTRYRLGLVQYLLGELDEAEGALQKAHDLAPDDSNILLALALLQEKLYTDTGERAAFNRLAASLAALQELSPEDPTPKNILRRAIEARGAPAPPE